MQGLTPLLGVSSFPSTKVRFSRGDPQLLPPALCVACLIPMCMRNLILPGLSLFFQIPGPWRSNRWRERGLPPLLQFFASQPLSHKLQAVPRESHAVGSGTLPYPRRSAAHQFELRFRACPSPPGSETNIPTSIPHPKMLWKRGCVRDRMLFHWKAAEGSGTLVTAQVKSWCSSLPCGDTDEART